MSLYYSVLKESSALNFAPGIYLPEYYLRVNMNVIGRFTSEQ